MPNKPPITITLDADLLVWIREQAAAEHLSVSAYLNRALHSARDVEERRLKYEYRGGVPE